MKDDSDDPGGFARRLLAAAGRPPRDRARDQQPDRAGIALQRRILERLAERSPEAGQLAATLDSIVNELGEPFGPSRAIARELLELYDATRTHRPPAVPVDAESDTACAALRAVGQKRSELAAIAAVYERIIRVVFPGAAAAAAVLDDDAARAKLERGVPILAGERLELSDSRSIAAWQDLVRLLDAHRNEAEPDSRAGDLASIDPVESLMGALDRTSTPSSNADPALFGPAAEAIRLWALPRLAPLVHRFEPLVRSHGWSRGECPGCGSWPTLAETRGLEQFRWLRCGLCGCGWQVDRMLCPYCATRDHRLLQELFVEGQQQRHRLSVCDGCRGYVRCVATLQAIPIAGLLVAELEMLHLDLVARDRGYFVLSTSY